MEVVKTNGDMKIKLNFQDTPLQTVLEYLSETAGLTVVSDEPIADSRMTVISRQPISLDQAVALINSMLKEKSLTTVLTGKTLKVVTLANAKKENIPVLTGRDPNAVVASDTVVTYIVPVGHVTAVALAENLKALLPEYASLEANEDGNALIITDTTANIKRLMQIVTALDTHMASVAEIRVFRLVNTERHERGQPDQQHLPAAGAGQPQPQPAGGLSRADGDDDGDERGAGPGTGWPQPEQPAGHRWQRERAGRGGRRRADELRRGPRPGRGDGTGGGDH